MTLTAAEIDRLPHVPISTFTSNPAHYLTSGAAVTTHGGVSAAFIRVADDTGGRIRRRPRRGEGPDSACSRASPMTTWSRRSSNG
ncbi:hypothetical protein ACPPVW_01500 [Leifsonia sp. McL0607]|uniref:hypothetical protein n=1 Tax=Leifsonia sp. McL0607 TaxID=3415672 RepID=UPI003CE96300